MGAISRMTAAFDYVPVPSAWDDSATTMLKELCLDLTLSCSQIAFAINRQCGTSFSRNAVIGKINREGWGEARKARIVTYGPRRQSHRGRQQVSNRFNFARAVQLAAPVDTPLIDDDAIPIAQRKTIMELANQHCRWPVGDPKSVEFFYCGDPSANVEAGRPYCAAHAARTKRQDHER